VIRITLIAATLAALAAPALAEPILYECKVDRLGSSKLTDAQRAEPQSTLNFAIDLEAGKGCRVEGGICSPYFGPLEITQRGATISGGGKRVFDGGFITLTFMPHSMRAIFISGGVTTSTRNNDCVVSDKPFVLP
jgi:hypothetical protein